MTLRFRSSFGGTSIAAQLDGIKDQVRQTIVTVVTEEATTAQGDLRDQVASSGLGQGLTKAWRLQVYPKGASKALSAAGLLYSKAPRLHTIYTTSGTISARGSGWLVIPTALAVSMGFAVNLPNAARAGRTAKGLAPKWSNVEAAIAANKGSVFFHQASSSRAAILLKGAKGSRPQVLFELAKSVPWRQRLDYQAPALAAQQRIVGRLQSLLGAN